MCVGEGCCMWLRGFVGMDCFLVLKAAFFLVFGACFLVQVRDQVLKFADRQTIMVQEMIKESNLTLPPFAVCPRPGYDYGAMGRLNLSLAQWSYDGSRPLPGDFAVPADREEADGWFAASTFSTGDVVDLVQVYTVLDNGSVVLADVYSSMSLPWSAEVEEVVSPPHGRCQIIRVGMEITNRAENIKAVLKFPPGVESLDVYVFESGLETTGVRLNYWLGHFQQITCYAMRNDAFSLTRGYEATLGLDRSVQHLNPDKKECQDDDEEDGDFVTATEKYQRCLLEEVKRNLRREENLCYWPPFGDVVPADRDVCKSAEEVRAAWTVLMGPAFLQAAFGNDLDCLPSCRQVDFRFQKRFTPDPGRDSNGGGGGGEGDGGEGWNDTVFYLYYNRIEVQHSWERVLYDLNNIVAAVGGSLGLFLGFSFFGTALAAVDWCRHTWANGGVARRGRTQITMFECPLLKAVL